MAHSSMLHVRVDDEIKAQAGEALAAMGLSVSDAVRILLKRVATDKSFPLELKVPNAETRAAMEEARTSMKEINRFEAARGKAAIQWQTQDLMALLRAELHAMNLPLPDALKSFVDEQVDQRGYGTSSEYLRELIRKDQDIQKLRNLLLAGGSTAPTKAVTPSYFEDLRSRVNKTNRSGS